MSRSPVGFDTLLPNASLAAAQQPRCVSMASRKTLELSCKKVSAFATEVPLVVAGMPTLALCLISTSPHENTGDRMTRNSLPVLGLALAVSLAVSAPLSANATDIVVATVNNG